MTEEILKLYFLPWESALPGAPGAAVLVCFPPLCWACGSWGGGHCLPLRSQDLALDTQRLTLQASHSDPEQHDTPALADAYALQSPGPLDGRPPALWGVGVQRPLRRGGARRWARPLPRGTCTRFPRPARTLPREHTEESGWDKHNPRAGFHEFRAV